MARKAVRKAEEDSPESDEPRGAVGKFVRAITGTLRTRPGQEKRLYKTDIVRRVARDTRDSQRAVSDALNGALKQISLALSRDEMVVFPGFGTYYTRMRPASTARSFATGKPVEVAAMRVAAFRAGEVLKLAVRTRLRFMGPSQPKGKQR
jgi:DNA-binding protein HU-beta